MRYLKVPLLTFLFLLAGFAAGRSVAGTAQALAHQLEWPELIDPVKGAYKDPFEALSSSQLRSLGIVFRARQALEQDDLPAEARKQIEAEMKRHEALLTVGGVDVDGLLAKRQQVALERAKASLAGNPKLEGEEVTLTGYVIPVFGDNGEDLGGYLVPQAGMCSHMPPPAPNQMIRYEPQSGWTGDYVYQPVRITGRLNLQVSRQQINLLDGNVEMIAAFDMTVDKVEELEDGAEADPKARSFNLFSSVKKLFHPKGGQ